jgi:hypothetical protein
MTPPSSLAKAAPTRQPNCSVLQPLALQVKTMPGPVRRSRSGSSSASVGSAITRTSSASAASSHSLLSFAYDRSRDTSNPKSTSGSSSRSPSTDLESKGSTLLHGDIPYKAGWLSLRTSGVRFNKKSVERFIELAGPCVMFSASPNTAILGGSYQVFGATVAPEKVPGTFRINIKTAGGEVLTLTAETRDEYSSWLKELQRAATRHITKDYVCDRIVGTTQFGSIATARDLQTGGSASVRITSKHSLPDELVTLARREALNLLSCPPHPTIPRVLDVYETPTSIYCVTETVPVGTSIRDLVQGLRPLSERDTSFVIHSLLQTLAVLHERKIVHRGCTADAVHLVSPERAERGIKLTSFEFAVGELDSPKDSHSALNVINLYGMEETMDTSIAPFVAPEVVKGDLGSYMQDSWAAGVLMHYCLVAATPFDGHGQMSRDALRIIQQACGMPVFRGVMWDGISRDAKDLCAKLLHADPRRRLSPQKALAHRWFRWNQ